MRGRQNLLFNLLLVGGCALLLLGIVNIWWGEEDNGAGVKSPAGLDVPKIPLLRGRESLEAYRQVVENNLFSPDRRGEDEARPAKGQASLEGSKLMGVIIVGVERAALITEPGRAGKKGVLVVRQGERWGNYQVVEITTQGVVLQGKEGRKTLDFPD
jgi:hypothetical protein